MGSQVIRGYGSSNNNVLIDEIFVCSLFVGVTSCVVLVLWYVLGVSLSIP